MVDSSRIVFATIPALLVGIVSMGGILMKPFPSGFVYLMIPLYAYIISLVASAIHQYFKCEKVEIASISLSNLAVLGTSAVTSGILLLENIPLKRFLFDETKLIPTYPTTGDPVPESSPSYKPLLESGAHLKFQFLSSIVRAALPVGLDANMQEGLIYFYYIFWMVLLPMYFLLGIQGFCK